MAGSMYTSLFGAGGPSAPNANLTLSALTLTTLTMADGGSIQAGVSSGLTIGGNANQKIALWGATPVVQPASTGELVGINGNAATAGNAANMNTNGNVGNTKYDPNDWIKAMKQAGLMAS